MQQEVIMHDFNNKLSVVFGAMEAIKAMLDNDRVEDAKKVASAGVRAVNGVKELMNDVLRNRKSKVSMEMELAKILGGMEEAIKIRTKVVTNEDVYLTVNRGKFNLAVTNIVKNAAEAGAKSVEFRLTKNNLIVADDGRGFSKEVITSFENHQAISTKKDGNGVGLRSLEKFAKENRWSVKIANHSYGGAVCFSFNRDTKPT